MKRTPHTNDAAEPGVKPTPAGAATGSPTDAPAAAADPREQSDGRGQEHAAPPLQSPAASGGGSAENPEPVALNLRTPLWLAGVLWVLALWGQHYFNRHAGGFHPLVFNPGETLADLEARVPKLTPAALATKGRRIYSLDCEGCHKTDGKGALDQFPPLADSEWVLAPGPNRLIRIVLDGLRGPVTVKNLEYDGTMLPWRTQLTDEDIAAVLTFIRGHKEWGHGAVAVTPAQVKLVRSVTGARGGASWTATELLQISDQE
jgi:mono/diheme cytochrome c family protein